MSLSADYPHRIRLRGPWECDPLDGPPPRRVQMPTGWAGAGLTHFRGVARFTRKFGYPGRVDATEHVWLTCNGVGSCIEVRLNNHVLTQETHSAFAFDVTAILSPRNRLEVLVEGYSDEAGLWGEVALEIRKNAYLSCTQIAHAGSTLHVTGLVAGAAPQPLELYTLVDGRHVDYRTIAPTAAGTPFSIELAEIAADAQLVRVELIHVSSIWYVVEMPTPGSDSTAGKTARKRGAE